ncbi:MAG: sensor histidine kinase [Thermoleophilia bacterium]
MIVLLAILLGLAVLAAAAAVLDARRARASVGDARAAAADSRQSGEVADRRAAATLDELPFIALRVDRDGRLAQANRVARERFAFLEPGMRVLEAFGEHELANRVAVSLRDLEGQRFEVRLFEDGRRTYNAVVAPYETGVSREALVFLTDASEAVAYQELRSQFVANVSHELRTPLTGLRGLLEALDDPRMDVATRNDFTARAANETLRLEALISDILFLSELESTHGLPSRDRSDLVHAVRVTLRELEAQAHDNGVRLEVDLPERAMTPLSEVMSGTVVRNLVENAVKYAGHGAVARTTVARAGDTVTLTVSDDGAGIPERHLGHVFERFYRADPSRSKRLGGTGLGLSIVKHIAERFGGHVGASSREGFGTTITVTLPAAGGDDLDDADDVPARVTRPEGP